ncbi:MAG: GGDEF domain-containing protein [Roseburia sp.]|nr:GGDEF domain-containing protein [Roseburia sp.]
MKGKLICSYKIMCAIFIIMLLYSMIQLRTDVYQYGWQQGYHIQRSMVQTVQKEEDAPAGQAEVYRFIARNIAGDYNTLLFYSIHENIRIYVGDECIYSMEGAGGNFRWRSPGCVWNEVALKEADNGKEIRVEVRPVYRTTRNMRLTFYLGCQTDILAHIIVSNLPILLISITFILAGIGCLWVEICRSRSGDENEMLKLFGLFLAIAGVWKLMSASVIGLISDRAPVLSMIPYWILPTLSIPYILSVKLMLKEKDGLVWDIPCIVSLVNIAGVVLLQCLEAADLRQTLLFTQIVLIFEALYGTAIVLKRLSEKGWQKKRGFTLFFCVGCVFWLAADMAVYYLSGCGQTTVIGMLGFAVYLAALVIDSAKEARQMMTVGMQARQYEKIAFHDPLTGLYNRAAYADYVSNKEFSPEEYIVAMFDLNNLKKCNDSLGHEKGDIYIRESARMIRECFGDIGQCYRVGGDEFCVLINRSTKAVCQGRMNELLSKVRSFNKNSEDIRMGIACGFEQFDNGVDRDIEDTVKRADQLMYQHKFRIKQEMAGADAVQGEQDR